MNCKEWHCLKYASYETINWDYYNKTRKVQKSLQYNPNPEAKIIHHLRDTEEQRKYNDEHYELWGHNLNGTFEYGKYVIFVTKEEHHHIHSCSEETRKKISKSIRRYWTAEKRAEWSNKMSGSGNSFYGKHHTPGKLSGENNGMYGKHLSKEARKAISEANKNKIVSEETRKKLSEASSGERNGMHGRKPKPGQWLRSVDLQKLASIAYKEYKAFGGVMKWQDFRREFFIENK